MQRFKYIVTTILSTSILFLACPLVKAKEPYNGRKQQEIRRRSLIFNKQFINKQFIKHQERAGISEFFYAVDIEMDNGHKIKQWVKCSTNEPFVAFKNLDSVDSNLIIHYLNPGGDMIYRYTSTSHTLYWGICHNIWNQRNINLHQKAKDLGYSTQLVIEQKEIPGFLLADIRTNQHLQSNNEVERILDLENVTDLNTEQYCGAFGTGYLFRDSIAVEQCVKNNQPMVFIQRLIDRTVDGKGKFETIRALNLPSISSNQMMVSYIGCTFTDVPRDQSGIPTSFQEGEGLIAIIEDLGKQPYYTVKAWQINPTTLMLEELNPNTVECYSAGWLNGV